MALSPNEELLLFSTDHNQIISVKINLEKPTDEAMPFDYLITSFHSKYINGLDTCIKKPMIATCSFDRTVRLWGFESRSHHCSLKIVQTINEEPLTLAFHPSGYHILVATPEHVKMMNVLDNKIETYHEVGIKNCRVLAFSNSGHYFACAQGTSVFVYKFYTAWTPPEFHFRGHFGPVIQITWFEDDTGFATCGQDNLIMTHYLFSNKE